MNETKRKPTREEIQAELDQAVRDGLLEIVGHDPKSGEPQYQETQKFRDARAEKLN